MKIVVLVKSSPYQHQSPDTAWHFVHAALEEGHAIPCVFFYQDGAYNANRLSVTPQDDRNIVERWSDLAREKNLKLILCAGSAIRRGIMDSTEAQRHGLDCGNLAKGFELAGLAQFVDHIIDADRVITFSG